MSESPSLRASLILRLAIALLAVAVVGTVVAYQLGSLYGNQAYDRSQAEDASTLVDQVTVDRETVQVNLPTAALRWLLADEGDLVIYRVTDLRSGKVVDANGDLGVAPEIAPDRLRSGFWNTTVNKRRMRVTYLRRLVSTDHVPILVEVAETMGKRDQMTDTVLVATMIFMAVISLVALGLVWHGVGRALSPLKLLEVEAEARSGADLAALNPMHAPEEVRGLIVAINRMMARVSSVMQSQNNFIANAAHQLRTPLSGLRLQAQLGLKSQTLSGMRDRLTEVEASAVRAADLVEKLLVLAKAESATGGTERQPVDFVHVAQQVIERFLLLADQHGVDLGLAAAEGQLWVQGSEFLFGELLGNLVDNAILHGRPGGNVTIELGAQNAQVIVAVLDDGPGFADTQTDLLFTRFYRGDSSSRTGSGLGLAIVHEIAERYGGKVTLLSEVGVGSRFEARFPQWMG